MKQRKLIVALAIVLVLFLSVGVLAACDPEPVHIDGTESKGWDDPNMYTMNDYTSQMPNQWCTILSNDSTNSSLEGYFTSSFYEFNYEYDEAGNIVPGGYTIDYSAATALRDVTADYVGQYGIDELHVDVMGADGYCDYCGIEKFEEGAICQVVLEEYKQEVPQVDEEGGDGVCDVCDKEANAGEYCLEAAGNKSNHAFAMTLRDDLVWDDGTPITAADFVYSMSQQLSPNYLFDTASNYYAGNYIIHNAQKYVMQGQSGWFAADTAYQVYSEDLDSQLIFTLEPATAETGYKSAEASIRGAVGFPSSYTAAMVVEYFIGAYGAELDPTATAALEGKTLAEIKADPELKAAWDALIGWWQTDPNEELDFFVAEYTYPAMDFSEVGFFVGENEYELVMVTDSPLYPIKEDGSLSYEAGYYFSGWPLVKKDLWMAYENRDNGVPYTNTYCTSVETSASWGAYKITNYQTDKTYTISRNDEWFGYGLEQYEGQYSMDAMVVNKIEEWDTAWMAFQNGQLDGIGMNVKIAADYRTSDRAYFTPDTATFDLNIQSLATSHTEERNNLLLNYVDFRNAISLALNRDDYCAKNNPSSQAALGLLNNQYYHDVENGAVYRETVQAKEAILNAYGATKNEDGSWTVGTTSYDDIDEALDATTGYNVALARQLVDKAVTAAIAAGDYVAGEDVILTYGTETASSDTDRVKNWFQATFDEMTKGTQLEGKVKIEYFFFSSNTWSEQFANGEYDLCFGAWLNAPFNPAYLLCETQIGDANRYAVNWEPREVYVTVNATPDKNHPEGEYTYNLEDWRMILQGLSDAPVNFKNFPMDDQLTALAAVETAILKAYYSIPVFSRYSASLMGYKCDYLNYDYNTFMGYGGIRFMQFHYTDSEWNDFVNLENGGTLNYK